jgi:outer membrane protein assembly factor BamA
VRAWTRRPAGRLVSEVSPYGSEPFGQAGLVAGLRLDTRDLDTHPTRGVLVALEARYHPAVWDVRKPFERLRAEAAGVLTAPWPLRPTLALRVVGERVLGDYPFHEAAYVGGANTVRGLSSERFAGDAGLSANLELRLRFGRYFLVLPGEYGVFALADTGRVWLAGEDSRRWHNGVGGGFWFAYVHPNNTVTLAIARSAEGTGFYVRAGFPF